MSARESPDAYWRHLLTSSDALLESAIDQAQAALTYAPTGDAQRECQSRLYALVRARSDRRRAEMERQRGLG